MTDSAEHPQDPVRIMCAADRAVFRHILVLLTSVSAETDAPLEVGVVSDNVTAAEQQELARLLPDIRFRFFEAKTVLPPGLKAKFALSPLCYARLVMADLVDWPRFVYLDVDMILRADIRALHDIDLQGAPCGAVFHGAKLNSGMIVFDSHAWHAGGYGRKCLDYALEFSPREADQDALLAVAGDRFCRIDPCWNVLIDPVWGRGTGLGPDRLEGARILHYVTGFKPWNLGRLLLPAALRHEWDRHHRPSRLPRDRRRDIGIALWQFRILAKIGVGRLRGKR